jgi:hypothetical protein
MPLFSRAMHRGLSNVVEHASLFFTFTSEAFEEATIDDFLSVYFL